MVENNTQLLCPVCTGNNHCELESAGTNQQKCWCMKVELPVLAKEKIKALNQTTCLCKDCLQKIASRK